MMNDYQFKRAQIAAQILPAMTGGRFDEHVDAEYVARALYRTHSADERSNARA
jgi:hypothetical protein